jgi:haloalkane dehalogenase
MRFLRTPDDLFSDLPGFPFAPHFVPLSDGLRMHHVDEGPRDGKAVLLLHGQPTWSYLYRKVIPVLVGHGYRVIAPDLIGFGRSDKPIRRTDHSVQAHTSWLLELLDALWLTDITLVAQDWGGPFGLGILARSPERFSWVVATNTVLHTADPSLAGQLNWACHTMPDGSVSIAQTLLDYQRITQEIVQFRPGLFVQGGTTTELPDDVVAAYNAPFPEESFCAGPRQLPLLMGLTQASTCARQNKRTLKALEAFDRPFLTAFSDGDPSTQGWERFFQEHVPGAADQSHVVIEGAGHFLQEDQGDELADVIHRFIAANPVQVR